jgi:signal transduction histidine kinase/CheY-like chemotaxis protein
LVEHAVGEALALGAAAEHHFVRRDRDGSPSYWSVRAQRLGSGVLLLATDVNAFAHAAQAVCAAQRDYVEATAHELRGPLSVIKAWASAADRKRAAGAGEGAGERVDPFIGETLQVIGAHIDRMSDLLNDLLDVARSDAGAVRAVRRSTPVYALVQRAVSASPFGDRVSLPDTLPGRVTVDSLHIEAVLDKLVAYVGRRKTEGPIELTVDTVESDLPGKAEVHIAIVDRGPPLSRKMQAALFGRYRKDNLRGSLGLYICQQLVAANGGRIWLEPYDDGAARFIVALPAEDVRLGGIALPSERGMKEPQKLVSVASPRSGREPSPGLRARAPLPPGKSRARLLFAERDPEMLLHGSSVLRLQGHEVVGAPSGEHFWKDLESGDFDVVLVDLTMPGVGGVAGLRRIRSRPAPPAVVVTLPSADRPEELLASEREGAQAVFPRPFDWAHLLALVHSAKAARLGVLEAL